MPAYGYGQVSEKTSRIRSLVESVSELGTNSSTSILDIERVLSSIDAEYLSYDDVFVNAAFSLLTDIVEDGALSDEERAQLSAFAGIYNNPISDDPVTEVAGKRIVLTGDFETDGGKSAVKEMVEAAGGRCTGSVSRKTNYVVAGALGSSAYGYGDFGGKIKQALDLQLSKSIQVKVVTEKALMSFFEDSSPEAMHVLKDKQERFKQQWASARVVKHDFEGLTEGQQELFDLVKAGYNVYLAGLGGTGKSYILDVVIDWAKSCDKSVVVCAPTGIAALNMGGCTIHRALGIRPNKTLDMNPNPWIDENSAIYAADLMIIDEISMCRMDLFDYLSLALKNAARLRRREEKEPCQLVVVGDFSQLPPVVPTADKKILEEKYGREIDNAYAFMGDEWNSWSFKHVELTEAIRQRDAEFVAALNACRAGDSNGVRWIEEHAAQSVSKNAITLCGTNQKADEENARNLQSLSSAPVTYIGAIEGTVEESDKPTALELTLKVGARVMALTNHFSERYMNGSLGTVIECADEYVGVDFDEGGYARLDPHTWEITKPTVVDGKAKSEIVGTFTQIPLKLAYAITIHKSQGQTFSEAIVYPDCWDPGQLYTALSRLTDVSGLCLAHHCPDGSLITSPAVLEFYDSLDKK